MQTLDLDSLLGTERQHATFHDSELESISIDFITNSIRLSFRIPCGLEPDHDLKYYAGVLTFSGIDYYAIEPVLYDPQANDTPSLWITSDGPLPDPKVPSEASVFEGLPSDAFAHYLYSSTTNSFIYVAAKQASFVWS